MSKKLYIENYLSEENSEINVRYTQIVLRNLLSVLLGPKLSANYISRKEIL
jgi:hypothetical protein